MKRRFAAVVMTMVLMLSMGAVTVFADGDVASVDGTGYPTLQQAVDAADGKTVTLLQSTAESITVAAGTTVTLDLGGCTLTNEANNHTITNYGNLTVIGTGTVDNVSHGRAAVDTHPGSVTVLNGGTFTRSMENGQSSTDNGSNSFYVIRNHGEMFINEGVTVTQNGKYSSMVENGYQNATSENTENNFPKMVISGGVFDGGLNTIKNDDCGVLEINGGSFINVAQQCVMNWNETTITDGTFQSDTTAVWNGSYGADSVDKGVLKIQGGSFTGGSNYYLVYNSTSTSADADVEITGGTFSSQYISQDLESAVGTNSAALTDGSGKYYVGTSAELSEKVADADAVTVIYGNAALTGLKDGAFVTNTGAGQVTANGISVGTEPVTVANLVENTTTGVKYGDLASAVAEAKNGETLTLLADVELDAMLNIEGKENFTLDLNGRMISPSQEFTGIPNYENDKHLVQILNCTGAVTIKNGTLQTGYSNKHALNVYTSEKVVLENMTLDHEKNFTGAPLVINATDVSVLGSFKLVTGEYSWYGINLDNVYGKASLTFEEGSTVGFVDKSGDNLPMIYTEDNNTNEDVPAPSVDNNSDKIGLGDENSGVYNPHTHTPAAERANKEEATCTKEGYTGDVVCDICGEVMEKGAAIEKTAHNYQNGKCVVCGTEDPNYEPAQGGEGQDSTVDNGPGTGDSAMTGLWILFLLVSGAGALGTVHFVRRYRA